MIKSSELRLGNFVHRVTKSKSWYGPDIERVERITGDYFYGDLPSSQCEPIPLTSEWLERFGFKWYDEEETNYDWGYKIGEFKISEMEFGDEEKEYHFQPEDIQINTVHQLQNLYFALTGSELHLKDKTV